MMPIDISEAIRLHHHWRRQFLGAFAGGSYADMPLSEHRGCMLGIALNAVAEQYAGNPDFRALVDIHHQFHARASNIIELSDNGLGSSADLLLPELSETAHQLTAQLDKFREYIKS